jgi:hypothetical protein
MDWLGVNERSLQFVMDQHRNPSFWNQPSFGQWEFNGWSVKQDSNYNHMDSDKNKSDKKIFEVNDKLELNQSLRYITIGKGWP